MKNIRHFIQNYEEIQENIANFIYKATVTLIPNHTKIQWRKKIKDKFTLWTSMQK